MSLYHQFLREHLWHTLYINVPGSFCDPSLGFYSFFAILCPFPSQRFHHGFLGAAGILRLVRRDKLLQQRGMWGSPVELFFCWAVAIF